MTRNSRMDGRPHLRFLLAGMLAAITLGVAAPAALGVTITEFKVPTAASAPEDITQGSDGNLWFAEHDANRIGRVIPTNPPQIKDFPTKGGTGGPFNITSGPDGNLWYPEQVDKELGKMPPTNPAGVTDFPVGAKLTAPQGIAVGPDNLLWVIAAADKVVRVNPATGTQVGTDIAVPGYGMRNIARGPDNNMWVTDFGTGHIGRLSTSALTKDVNVGHPTWDITSGPDGALWFTMPDTGFGRITTGGSFKVFAAPGGGGDVFGLTQGPDKALWGARAVKNDIARITTGGAFSFFRSGGAFRAITAASRPEYIAQGPGNTLWFTEKDGNRIGRITGIPIPGGGGDGTDVSAPKVSKVRVKPKRVIVGLRSTRVVFFGRKRRTGTKIGYTTSEAGKASLKIQRILRGRRSRGRCRRPTRRLRNRRKCKRYKTRVTLRRTAKKGRNRVRFSGRVRKRRLRKGRYRVVVRVRDGAGNLSKRKTAGFRIVGYAKRKRRP